MQSFFVRRRGAPSAGKRMIAGPAARWAKTHCIEPLLRRRAMGIESRRVSRRTWNAALRRVPRELMRAIAAGSQSDPVRAARPPTSPRERRLGARRNDAAPPGKDARQLPRRVDSTAVKVRRMLIEIVHAMDGTDAADSQARVTACIATPERAQRGPNARVPGPRQTHCLSYQIRLEETSSVARHD